MSQPVFRDVLSWRAALLSGLLWGVAVATVSTITQPLLGLPILRLVWFAAQLLVQWCVTGCVLALGARLCRGPWLATKLAFLGLTDFATAVGIQWLLSRSTYFGTRASVPVFGLVPLADLSVYIGWLDLFYGGLYLAGYFALRRTAAIRQRLASLQLAQGEADALLRERRVAAHRGQLQPGVLLVALAALRERYASDQAAGDALFDRLIAFLRSAMPSVRSGISTLAAEWETVGRYAALRDTLGLPGGKWQIERAVGSIPALPFPSLILLPAFDAIGEGMPADGTLILSLRAAPQAVIITLAADRPAELPDVLHQRLRAGLAMTFGTAAQLSPASTLPLVLRLPVRMTGQNILTGKGDNDDDDHAETFSRDRLRDHPVDPVIRR